MSTLFFEIFLIFFCAFLKALFIKAFGDFSKEKSMRICTHFSLIIS